MDPIGIYLLHEDPLSNKEDFTTASQLVNEPRRGLILIAVGASPRLDRL